MVAHEPKHHRECEASGHTDGQADDSLLHGSWRLISTEHKSLTAAETLGATQVFGKTQGRRGSCIEAWRS